jgi:hypothetical protein
MVQLSKFFKLYRPHEKITPKAKVIYEKPRRGVGIGYTILFSKNGSVYLPKHVIIGKKTPLPLETWLDESDFRTGGPKLEYSDEYSKGSYHNGWHIIVRKSEINEMFHLMKFPDLEFARTINSVLFKNVLRRGVMAVGYFFIDIVIAKEMYVIGE